MMQGTTRNKKKITGSVPELAENRRQEIIDAASLVIDRKGYDGATIQEVADAGERQLS